MKPRAKGLRSKTNKKNYTEPRKSQSSMNKSSKKSQHFNHETLKRYIIKLENCYYRRKKDPTTCTC